MEWMWFWIELGLMLFVVLGVVRRQLKVAKEARQGVRRVSGFFPSSDVGYKKTPEITIAVLDEYNEPLKELVGQINQYIDHNRGSQFDIQTVREMVDRSCDSELESVESRVPVPLYYGLLGTMLGVIVGVGMMALRGFVSNGAGLTETTVAGLLSGVALAMVASAIGIGLTTCLSRKSSEAIKQMGGRKRVFFSWMQVELVPSLVPNVEGAISQFTEQLKRLDVSFSGNTTDMTKALQRVREIVQGIDKSLGDISNVSHSALRAQELRALNKLGEVAMVMEQFNQRVTGVGDLLPSLGDLGRLIGVEREKLVAQREAWGEGVKRLEDIQVQLRKAEAARDEQLKNALEIKEEFKRREQAVAGEVRDVEVFHENLNESLSSLKALESKVEERFKLDTHYFFTEVQRSITEHGQLFEQGVAPFKAVKEQLKEIAEMRDELREVLRLARQREDAQRAEYESFRSAQEAALQTQESMRDMLDAIRSAIAEGESKRRSKRRR